MAPLGYHLELLSDHYFVLTNEDAVFVHMNDVSVMLVLILNIHLYIYRRVK